MTAMDANTDSAAARERGNDFYRKRQFAEAEKAYEEAARLAPDDAAPWSNISAIKFEQGNYRAALNCIDKALELTPEADDHRVKRQKLYTRKAKCHLHTLSIGDAQNAVGLLADDASASTKELRQALGDMQKLWSTVPDEATLRKQTLDRLTRYKSQIQDRPEYYPMGHDVAEPLLDKKVREAMPPGGDLAFMLCGSGDARHLFITLIDLFSSEKGAMSIRFNSDKKFGKVHFTLVDLNAAALARTLVFFDMIFVYAVYKAKGMPRLEDALTCMAYAFSSAFIPPFVESKMLESVNSLVDELQKAEDQDLQGSDVLSFIYIPKATRKQVLRKLKQWAEPLPEDFQPKTIRKAVSARYWAQQESKGAAYAEATIADKPEACFKAFRDIGVIFADDVFIQRREPELLPLVKAFHADRPGAKETLSKHVDANWVTNPTVLDLDWEPCRHGEVPPGMPEWDRTPVLDWSPLALVGAMSAGNDNDNVLRGLGKVFDILSLSVISLSQRIHIEVIAGEMADTLERIRYDSLEHRSHKPPRIGESSIDPTRFPRTYDRIHMSNIPDYIGGPLTAHIYGRPVLREDRPSNLMFNNLLNPPEFRTHDDFLTEYMLMYDDTQITDHFGLVRHKHPDFTEESARLEQTYGNSFMAENYFIWDRAGLNRIPRNRMMPRSSLEHWLYAHLLKICLPYRRPQFSPAPVHAPLNLTAFLRLVIRMHEVGYPAHWLSGILASICEGTITTTARAPREMVLKAESVSKSYPSRKISLGPFKAEFTTLLSLWRRLLPFGVIAPSLVQPDDIVECRITFPDFIHPQGRTPHFALIFFNGDVLGRRHLNLPDIIQDDEIGDTSEFAGLFREKGVHVVMNFTYVTDDRVATFWMRKDVVAEVMKGDSWAVGFMRTDLWEVLLTSLSTPRDVLHPLSSWI